MPLKLYNTLTRRKEDFVPLDPKNVRMYVCGPTVYDYAHIGNARPVIVFDVLFRLLRHIYGESHVTYVRNITDVDDKINARAREEGVPIRDLTARTARQFHEDIAALGVLQPTIEPRATDHIAEMIVLSERLTAKGHAYAADGHVLFDVTSTKDYGRLSRRSLDEMMAGARVDVAPYKKGDMDFVLWKPSDKDTPGWDSPWGRGRPGWHIECSAMSWKHLGEVFDIHGGGIDLLFPHHENELAQTRCAFGHKVMATIWMHNGFLQAEGQKMSKSLGNFVTINELLATEKFGGRRWIGDWLRLSMLRTHYRQPIDWTVRSLEESLRIWASFRDPVPDNLAHPEVDPVVLEALSDDLNTPRAVARLFELRDKASNDIAAARRLVGSLQLLGLFSFKFPVRFTLSYDSDIENMTPSRFWSDNKNITGDLRLHEIAEHLKSRASSRASHIVQALLKFQRHVVVRDLRDAEQFDFDKALRLDAARLEARKVKNWVEGDHIRDELAAMGIAIKDNKDGTTSWEVKR